MRTAVLLTLITFVGVVPCAAQGTSGTPVPAAKTAAEDVLRIEGAPEKGFFHPYYLYVPPEIASRVTGGTATLLVIPNNTGKSDDDFAVHDSSAKRLILSRRDLANKLSVALLVPAFPRPRADGQIYTHALARNALITDKKELQRLDLQAISQIDDARQHLRTRCVPIDARVLIYGFSASGMFANRFVFLHPELVKAAAFGSPGGWALAPVTEWQHKALRYPIGTSAIARLTGKSIDMTQLQKLPLFLFMGADDANDSVIYRVSFDLEDQDQIFTQFGKTLIERWTVTERMYGKALPLSTLKLYPGVAHAVTKEMWTDIIAFFAQHLKD